MEKECKHPTCGSTCRREKKPKKFYRIPARSAKPAVPDDKIIKAEMDLFWLSACKALAAHPYCMECGAFIPAAFYRAATAHVLPKRKEFGFPSVASNIINRLFLGAGCGCHNKYDRSWQDAATMKVFPHAVEIFKLLYPSIDPAEHKNIPKVFLKHIVTGILCDNDAIMMR